MATITSFSLGHVSPGPLITSYLYWAYHHPLAKLAEKFTDRFTKGLAILQIIPMFRWGAGGGVGRSANMPGVWQV